MKKNHQILKHALNSGEKNQSLDVWTIKERENAPKRVSDLLGKIETKIEQQNTKRR